ncbi:helix-turn-helix domain-containing protein [bacterium]|nr:helix-turn-helix domain-containing protein [bacterium]
MAHALKKVLGTLPKERREKINRRYRELVDEVESLKELRRLSKLSQVKLAKSLAISQPAVSKIEKQTDMYLSTLRSYVEAIGGELDVIIRLPDHGPVKLKSIEDVTSS